MGRDIWVALERKNNDGPWYNTDMFFQREEGLVRVPFYTGRNSILFDILHSLSTPILFKKASKGTQESLLRETYTENRDLNKWVLEKVALETLRVHYEDLVKGMELTLVEDPEWLDTNGILDLESFLKDLIEYIKVTLRDEYFGGFNKVVYRIIFHIE